MDFETDGKVRAVRPFSYAVRGSVASVLQASRERAGLMSVLALCSMVHTGVAFAADEDNAAAAASTAASTAAASTAAASTAAAADATAASDQLQEVVVSATHRNTDLQNTAISISAVSADTLTSSGVSSMQDLSALVPDLRMEGGRDGGGRINMRGIAAPSGEATVGLYYDDVPMSGPSDTSQTSGSFTQEANLFDVERVEALSGPQGTLYGAGAMGGTVRVLFKQASTSMTDGTVDTNVSEINHGGMGYWAKAAYNIPVVDDVFGVRVALWREHRGGYVDDDWIFRGEGWAVAPGHGLGTEGLATPNAYCATPPCTSVTSSGEKDVNTDDISGGRVMMKFTPNDWMEWNGMAMYQATNMVLGSWNNYYPWNATDESGQTYQTVGNVQVANPNAYTTYSPILSQQQDNFLLLSSPFKFTLPFANLDYIPSYYNWNRAVGGDYSSTYSRNAGSAGSCASWVAGNYGQNVYGLLPSASSVPACTTTQQQAYADYIANKLNPSDLVKPNYVKSFINEFRVSSNETSNFGGTLQWLLGVYNERRKDHVDSTEGQVTATDGLVADLWDFPVYWWRYVADDIKQTAYFADTTYKPGLPFMPGLTIDLGIRRFDYEKYTVGGVMMNGYGDGDYIGNPQISGSGSSANGWLPKYNVSYQLTPDAMVYGTVSKGYRPGGANVLPQSQIAGGNTQFLNYQPDSVWNFELGEKSSWLDRSLILDGAVYVEDWINMQTSLTTPNGGSAYVGNAGSAQIQGQEWTLTWLPVHGLNLIAGVSNNWKAELTSNQAADGVAPTNTQGHKGDPLPYVAKLNGSFDADYNFNFRSAMAFIRLNYSYTGSSRTHLRPQSADPQSASIGGYGTLNLRVGAAKDGWTASIFINNLTDRIGVMDSSITAAYASNGSLSTVTQYYNSTITTTTPREAGINIRKDF